MKNLTFLLLFILFFFTSCIDITDLGKNSSTTKPEFIIDENLLLDEDFLVDVIPGHFTIVTYNDDTLAITGEQIKISVPKMTATKSESGLKQEFIEYSNLGNFSPEWGLVRGSHILMFEDSKNADFDYNDFIAFVKHDIYKNDDKYYISISVKPIAMGATKNIMFGYEDNNGEERILSNNIRRDYFGNSSDMVNTSKQRTFKAPIETITNPDNSKDGWYTYFPTEDDYLSGLIGSYKISKNSIISGLEHIESYPENQRYNSAGYITYAKRETSCTNEPDMTRYIKYFIKVDDDIKFHVASKLNISTSEPVLPYGLAIPVPLSTYPSETVLLSEIFPNFLKWIESEGKEYDTWYQTYLTDGSFPLDTKNLYRW